MSSFRTVSKFSSQLRLKLKSSDQEQRSDDIPPKLDNSYIETAIFTLFKINIVEHIRLRASLTKQFHIPPQSFDKMPYWEYEIYLKRLSDLVKEENDSQKKEMDKYHISDYAKMSNPSNMRKMMNPKMPSMSGIGSGGFKMPGF